MNIKSELLAMARNIETYGFYPYALRNREGNICFVEALEISDSEDSQQRAITLLSRAVPLCGYGSEYHYSQSQDASIQWAMHHNLSTDEAVSFIREVAATL